MSAISTPLPTPPDNFSTQIASATVSSSAITFNVDDASGLPTEGVGVLFKKDSDGEVVAGSIEFIHWTGVSGNTINLSDTGDRGLTGSDSGAQAYVADDYFEVWVSSYYYDSQYDAFTAEHNTDGTHGAVTATSVALGGDTALAGNASQAEVATGTSDALVVTPTGASIYGNSSMSRQAIINGNFDIWQRGTSFTPTNGAFTTDRWKVVYDADSGTLPTDTITRVAITAGGLFNSFYCWNLNVDGAGSSLGNDSYYIQQQFIEHGVRNLCGASKTVTLSFWAKSDIADKKIGYDIEQVYGTGGTPSATETINGGNTTLTSSWQKITQTFTTNTLASKTFGTANDDYLKINIWHEWGSTYQSRVGASGAEDFGGAGDIQIAQVQLCAGSVALPFQPKSYAQELADCQRYCYVIGPGSGIFIGAGFNRSNATGRHVLAFPVTMRTAPTDTFSDGAHFSIAHGSTSEATTGMDATTTTTTAFMLSTVAGTPLTAGQGSALQTSNASAKATFDAEL